MTSVQDQTGLIPESVFENVSVILPVMNETTSLTETVKRIQSHSDAYVKEYLAVVCQYTTPESISVCKELQHAMPERFIVIHQELPFLGGAVRSAFQQARGSHIIMMASDLETDPDTVRDFVTHAQQNPNAIVTASRWIAGGSFKGYNTIKLVANYLFQKCFSLLYQTSLTDMTYGYRIFPSAIVKSIKWEELRHPFLFETLIKPLRLGVEVIEVPSHWHVRVEGESQNTFMRNFMYFRIGFKTRFYSKSKMLSV